MKVVFIAQVSGYMVIDIVNKFADNFHEVTLITGILYKQERNISPKVKIKKIIRPNNFNLTTKFLTWLISVVQIFLLLLLFYRHCKIMYFTLPPFSYIASLFLKNEFSIIVYDVYPDVLKVLRFKESNVIYKLFSKINKKIFLKAQKVYTITEGLKQTLSKNYIKKKNIKVVYGWHGLNLQNVTSFCKDHFLTLNKWQNKFIILYSGNIGIGQNIDMIFKLSEHFKEDTKIQFVLVTPKYKKYFNNNKNNLYISGYLQIKDYSHLLSKTKLSLIFMSEKNDRISFPSKIFNSFSFEIPILSIAPHNSEIAEIISEQNCGKNFEENQFNQITEYINTLKTNPGFYKKLSENSKSATEKYNLSNVSEFLIDDEK